jgi:hypothetical protein
MEQREGIVTGNGKPGDFAWDLSRLLAVQQKKGNCPSMEKDMATFQQEMK